jgi:hypothetical protein
MVNIKINGGIQNTSVQVGDTAYYVPETSLSLIGEQQSSNVDPINVTYLIGEITAIGPETITIDNPSNTPSPNDFVMFRKNENVNNTSLIGYYAEVKLRNDSPEEAELFALSSEIVESSK